MDKPSDNRTCRRNVIHQNVSFELIERSGGGLRSVQVDGIGVDLSSEGVGVFTEYPLREGEVLKLRYPVNVGDSTLPVYTEVMWSRPSNQHFRAGLRFLA